ncbi:MAG: DNA replication/repair protein RecF [bacterium]|nr:DNA replication/repair protein RecF [bacterium]
MFLKKICLENYRNYENVELEFNSRGNLLFGKNGQGKTNLLEAIYYLSVFRSFRKGTSSDIVTWDTEDFHITGFFDTKNEIERRIEVFWKRGETKKVYFDNDSVERLSELIGNFPIVILSPESIEITQGMPAERRRFLDLLISQADKLYLDNLSSYRKVLRQRNSLLYHDPDRATLDIWTEKLIEHGVRLQEKRTQVLEKMSGVIGKMYSRICQGNEELLVKYRPSIEPEDDLRRSFEQKLINTEHEERRKKTTLVGPHRDEIRFFINGYDARKYGSQGQHKSILMALKSAEIMYLKEEKGIDPVILLDDLFAMLDQKRIMAFLGILKEHDQFFITANAGLNPEVLLSEAGFKKTEFSQYLVEAGKISDK